MKMTHEQALDILGLSGGETLEQIRAAFAVAIRRVHPDTAGGHVALSSRHIEMLKLARDLLLRFANGQGVPCPNCRGKGCIRGRIGGTNCQRCEGTGSI